MKRKIILTGSILLLMLDLSATVLPKVWQTPILRKNVNVRQSIQIMEQNTVTVSDSGTMVVHFDGWLISSQNDIITLAASDKVEYGSGYNHLEIMAINNEIHYTPFSHTMTYKVGPGNHTYYALAHNKIKIWGDGIISLYGNLTIEFFPFTPDGAFVLQTHIADTNLNVRGTGKPPLAKQIVTFTDSGTAVIRFDGFCYSYPGDLIRLAAGNKPSCMPLEGSIGLEAYNTDLNQHSFSHTKVYRVGPGTDTFYASAENIDEIDGNGLIYIQGSLLVEFFPKETGQEMCITKAVIKENVNLRGNPVILSQIDFHATVPGDILLSFDGYCNSSPNDDIFISTSYTPSILANYGCVAMRAVTNDVNKKSFSLSIRTGVYQEYETYYVVAQNLMNQTGSGMASIYGNFVLKFFPDWPIGIADKNKRFSESDLILYPNPSVNTIRIQFNGIIGENYDIVIFDQTGRIVYKSNTSKIIDQIDVSAFAIGVYQFRLITKDKVFNSVFVKQ